MAWSSSTRAAAPSPSRKSRQTPKSNYAVTGLYFYDDAGGRYRRGTSSLRRAANWKSPTSTASISNAARLHVELMGRGYAWLDTGTPCLADRGGEIRPRSLEQRQGLRIACPEEIAYNNGFITREQLLRLAAALGKSGYGRYLQDIAEEEIAMAVE